MQLLRLRIYLGFLADLVHLKNTIKIIIIFLVLFLFYFLKNIIILTDGHTRDFNYLCYDNLEAKASLGKAYKRFLRC